MAATNKTPILLYGSTTATNVPVAGNLTNNSDGCEIAINVADKNLFFKDSGNVVNTVPIRQSSASSNGWLSSTDWTTFNNKQPAGTYVTSVSGTAPIVSSGGTTPAISMAAATSSVNGYLTSTDWTTFNNKAPALTYTTNYVPYGQGTTTPALSSLFTFDGTTLTSPANSVTGLNSSGRFVPTGSTVPTNGMYLPGSNFVGFATNSAYCAGFDSLGFALFGTNAQLQATSSRMNIAYSNASYIGVTMKNTDNFGATAFQFLNNSGTLQGQITTSGSGSTTYGTSSDYRLKDNIVPMQNGLETINLLRPVSYTWKETGEKTEGFIAHELQTVIPESVTGEKDGVNKFGEPDYQCIDTSFIVPYLVGAIQELQQKLKAANVAGF